MTDDAGRCCLWAVVYGLAPQRDGNQWYVLLGDNPQEGVIAFGDTPTDAIYAFENAMKELKGKWPV